MKRLIFTVTNDLNYDQRMQRICGSLVNNGFDVLLVGRTVEHSIPLQPQPYQQKRLNCFFQKKVLFYVEFNTRLFFYLLAKPFDAVCAIDLDTIMPCYFVSILKNKTRVYDAHELFTEQKEIVTRKFVYTCWLVIEKYFVPKFQKGYTVNEFISEEFFRRYKVRYNIVRNLPVLQALPQKNSIEKYILYQGAVNEGRCFEMLIPAMHHVNAKLVICGEGNFFEKVKKLISEYQLDSKVELKGYILPEKLKSITTNATIGLTLFEPTGLNQFYSLSNRFFDYIMGGVPQLCVNFPEYKKINEKYEAALLIDQPSVKEIAEGLNKLLNNDVLLMRLQHNCLIAREQFNWQAEEKILVDFWNERSIWRSS